MTRTSSRCLRASARALTRGGVAARAPCTLTASTRVALSVWPRKWARAGWSPGETRRSPPVTSIAPPTALASGSTSLPGSRHRTQTRPVAESDGVRAASSSTAGNSPHCHSLTHLRTHSGGRGRSPCLQCSTPWRAQYRSNCLQSVLERASEPVTPRSHSSGAIGDAVSVQKKAPQGVRRSNWRRAAARSFR